MEYFYYDSNDYLCVKEKYRENQYGLNEINLASVSNIDNLIKDIQDVYQNNIKNKSAYIHPLQQISIYGLSHGIKIFFHNIKKTNIIDSLIMIGFKTDLNNIEIDNFKKSKNYKKLSYETKLQLELE